MSKNIYELGVVTEIFQVTKVEKFSDAGKGVNIGYGPVEGLGTQVHPAESDRTFDPRFTSEDVQVRDVIVIDFDAPGVRHITQIFREGLKVFPPQSPDFHEVLDAEISFRRANGTMA